MRDCDAADPPELGDLYYELPVELHRGYRVVGLEEGKDPTVYRLLLERVKWGEFVVAAVASDRSRGFYRDAPSGRRA